MNYVAEFERYLREDGKSSSTILSYVGDIAGFLEYLTAKGTSFDGQLVRFFVTSYKQHLESLDYKVNTINKKINSLVCFNQFLIQQGQMTSMVVDLKKDKTRIAYGSEQEVEVYTDSEVERLLFYIQNQESQYQGQADRTSLALYRNSGE